MSYCIVVEGVTRSREEYEQTGHIIWEVKTDQKMISITFDDGPHPVYTPQILDVLANYNAKATFFITGNKADKYPDVLKRIVKEGHEVANHTYNHIYNAKISSNTLIKELDLTARTIKRIAGITPSLYRPVGGFYNDTITNTAVKKDYLVIMWSLHQDPKDWTNPGINRITKHVLKSVRPGDIVILHDAGGDRSQTVKALKSIMDYLIKHDYKMCNCIRNVIFF